MPGCSTQSSHRWGYLHESRIFFEEVISEETDHQVTAVCSHMWDLHPTVFGGTGAFPPAPILVGSGEVQGHMLGWRAHIGLGSRINGATQSLRRRDWGL